MTDGLSRIVDAAKVQTITDLLHNATGISASVADPDGGVFADSGWQEVCRHFHWSHPLTKKSCRRSDETIAFEGLSGRRFALETCGNGFAVAAVPLTVLGQHVANFIVGQFLLHPPDIGFFKERAVQAGFNETAYLEALSRVPVIEEGRVRAFLQCFSVFLETIGEAGLKKLADEARICASPEEGLGAGPPGLEGACAALQALLRQRQEERVDLEENMLSNVRDLVLPYVGLLRKSDLSGTQASTVDMIEATLEKITLPFVRKIQTFGLTAREIVVASLLTEGKTTKEIAGLLNVSARAVEFRRYNIRKKLKLDPKTSLESHLLAIG